MAIQIVLGRAQLPVGLVAILVDGKIHSGRNRLIDAANDLGTQALDQGAFKWDGFPYLFVSGLSFLVT